MAKDNMLHHLAQKTSEKYWSIVSRVAFIAFFCVLL